MSDRYIVPPKRFCKARKYNGKCEGCGMPKPPNEVYCRVDGNNYAITYKALYLCKECYIKKYGERE